MSAVRTCRVAARFICQRRGLQMFPFGIARQVGLPQRAAAALRRNKITHTHTREQHRPNTRNNTLCTPRSLCRRAPEGGAICTASASRNRVLSCLHATLYTLLWSNPHARAFLHLWASVRSNTSQSDQTARGFLLTAPGAVFSELSRALRVHAQAGWGEGSHAVAPASAEFLRAFC